MHEADILVIDDDPVVTRMLGRVLAGHPVTVTHSGEAALECLRNRTFALILCDLTMPGMSGIVFYRAVKDISEEMAKRVVFMTGGAFTPDAERLVAVSTNRILEKPFSPAEALAAVRDTIARLGPAAATGADRT